MSRNLDNNIGAAAVSKIELRTLIIVVGAAAVIVIKLETLVIVVGAAAASKIELETCWCSSRRYNRARNLSNGTWYG